MKIRTQFIINIVVLGIILLLASAGVIISNQWLRNAHQQEMLATVLERQAYELGYLANDYLLYRESQQADRWESKSASFSDELSKVQVNTPEQRALLADIRTNQQRLAAVFADIRASIESAPQTQEAGFDATFMQVSWSRLEVQTQGMIFNASRLERMLSDQEDQLTRLNSLLDLVLIAGLGVFLSVIYWSTFRRTLQAIDRLQDGTRIIGSGDLDFAIPVKSEDEIGELSRAFNRMTANLKQVTASKADLEKEIIERKQAEETLRKKEAEVRSLYESMTELFVLHEVINDATGKAIDYRILECNPAFEKITGIQRNEVIGGLASRVYGTGEAPYLDIYARVAETGEPVVFETEFSPMGKHFHISVFSPERGRFATLTSDITERKQAEQALHRFELLSANSKDIILFMRREDGCILEANAAAVRAYGYSRAELLALTIRDLRAPDTLGLTADQMAQADAGGILFETIHRRKDGTTFPVEVSSQGATIGGVRTLISIVRDITERKQAEEEIASLAKFPSENPNPILRVQTDGRLIYANAASHELLEWWGCEVDDCLPEELKDLIAAAVDNDLNQTVDVPCNDKVYSILLVPIVESGYVNIYGRDITERKQAEEALQLVTEDLRRSNTELEQFAYVASHDLQEPLRMVSSYVQLLGRRYQGKLDNDADDFINYAVDGAKRMQNLINDLLAYSRVGTRGNPHTLVSAEEVVKDALANLQFLIEESRASITHESLPVISGDSTQLVLVFQNLVGNAIKFRGSEPPRIQIGAQPEGDEWIFTVRDNGIGLDPKFAERIFVIFQRLHDRTAYPGTGIGLAICKRIIQRHGGRIWVESMPGEGATFYFTLPRKATL